MTKHELRRSALEARKALTEEAVADFSLAIANKLLDLPIWTYKVYHLFMSIAHQKEVQTDPIITLLQAKDKVIAVPKMQPKGVLKHYLLEDETRFELHRFGVPEPVDAKEIAATEIDVVFVPLLCFDADGNRLGYGKGYYDQFLAQAKPGALFVGLSLLEKTETALQPEAHDVRLHYAVTPNAVYRFSS